MKEKRYFCDLLNDGMCRRAVVLLLIVPIVVAIMIGIVIGNISYAFLMNKYSYELNAYSEDTEQYAIEIANAAIKEGSSFDLATIPEDVVEYSVTLDGNQIEFKYFLKNDLRYAPSAHMTITLSKDFEILQKSFSYTSVEEYKKMIKSSISSESSSIGFYSVEFILLCYLIFLPIGDTVSSRHKKRDENFLFK